MSESIKNLEDECENLQSKIELYENDINSKTLKYISFLSLVIRMKDSLPIRSMKNL
jgi:hypothetical protein